MNDCRRSSGRSAAALEPAERLGPLSRGLLAAMLSVQVLGQRQARLPQRRSRLDDPRLSLHLAQDSCALVETTERHQRLAFLPAGISATTRYSSPARAASRAVSSAASKWPCRSRRSARVSNGGITNWTASPATSMAS
jgi:hypothetical protein